MLVRTSRSSRTVRPKHVRLCVELLEDRSLLSATPFAPTHLLVTDDAGELRKVEIADGTSAADALAAYQARPDVAAVEIDHIVSVSVIPNDSRFGDLWGMRNTGQSGGTVDADIDADQAWDTATGSMTVAVGVIDSGIDYRHPDLYLNIWLNQGELPSGFSDADGDGLVTFRDLNASPNRANLTDLNGNGYIDAGDLLADARFENGSDNDGNGYVDDLIGWDFVNNDNDPMDDNNHGTHVAGTIGATGNNGTGVVGVNWRVSMAALKFLSASGSGATSGALAALNYAVGEGIEISNNSWGGGGFSSSMNTAINNARAAGHVFVAAAGNSSSNNDATASYPSNYGADNVVAVASTDRFDNLSSFSSYGATTVDLGAPGSAILSTTSNNTYSSFNGTSMATPHVAGAAALLWANDPSLTYSQVIGRLLNNVDQVSSLTGRVVTGGRLNVAKALAAGNTDTAGPRVVSASLLGTSTAVTGVRLTFSEVINAGSFGAADVTGLIGPAGSSLAVAAVTPVGTTGTVFDVTFTSTQTASGSYQLDVGPNVTDTAGNLMDQNANGVEGEATDAYRVAFSIQGTTTKTYTSSTTAVAIRDRRWSSKALTVGDDVTIGDVNVRVNISHTYDGDLQLLLIGPDGTQRILSLYRGGSGNNYTGTTFDDEAATAISAGSPPFSGTYRPEQSLSGFDGKNARGTWTLWVYDRYSGDVGSIGAWSLIVTGQASGQATVMDAEGGGDVGGDVGGAAGAVGGSFVAAAPPLSSSPADVAATADTSLSLFVAGEERDALPCLAPAEARREGEADGEDVVETSAALDEAFEWIGAAHEAEAEEDALAVLAEV